MALTDATDSSAWWAGSLMRPVVDLARAIDFYVQGLGFGLQSSAADRATLRLGSERLELVAADVVAAPAEGPDPRFQHAAIVARDMAAAYERLMGSSPRPITRGGPQRLPAAAGGVVAFKFRDPDGHPLELIEFPPGNGDVRWQARDGAPPTLGIDHFALSVRSAAPSIAFYEREFGFAVATRQVNHGEAQARLDGLAVSTVAVIALRPGRPGTPHVELLCYADPLPRPARAAEGALDCLLMSSKSSGPALPRTDPDGHALDARVADDDEGVA